MRVLRKNYSPVAQQVECAVVTRLVVGSNPTRGALEFVGIAPNPKTDVCNRSETVSRLPD